MSEYWVSKKKYFCKYCDIYITDDAPSRTQHENGMRHQGNKERFVKSLYKAGEKRKKDEEEEKREMKAVEAAAARAYALDVGAGRAGPSSAPALAAPQTPAPPPKKPSDPFTNYTTAEFLGYKDPDAERLKAERERRRTQGFVGDWEAVQTSYIPSPPALDVNPDVKSTPNVEDIATAGTKRGAEAPADVDDVDGRAWKLRKKPTTLGDIYDPHVIPIKIKTRANTKEDPAEAIAAATNAGCGNGIVPANKGLEKGTDATGVPKWTKIEWKMAVNDSTLNSLSPPSAGEAPPTPAEPTILAKTEVDHSSLPQSEPAPALKSEPMPVDPASSATQDGSLFKKRKAPSGGAGRGRRAQF